MSNIPKSEDIERKTIALIEVLSSPLNNATCYDDPLPPLKELDLNAQYDGHTILSVLVTWNLEKAAELIDLMHRQYLGDSVILTALNLEHPAVKNRIKNIIKPSKNRTAEENQFCLSLMGALSREAFITQIEGKKVPYYRCDLDDQMPDTPPPALTQEAQTLPPAATLAPAPALTPAFLPDNPNAIPTTPPTPAVITHHKTTPSKRSIKNAGKETLGVQVTPKQSLFWYAAKRAAQGKQRT